MSTLLAQGQGFDIGNAFKLRGDTTLRGTFTGVRAFVAAILPNAFVAAGIIVLILIIVAGVGIVANASNPDAQNKSKSLLQNAVIGFLLIFASYWIIQIIQALTDIDILGTS